MGVVYKARHKLLNSIVAVKILLKQEQEIDQRRFLLEAQLASKLSHPNIVYISDFGLLPDGRPYLVMEFIEGPTLSRILRKSKGYRIDMLRACKIAVHWLTTALPLIAISPLLGELLFLDPALRTLLPLALLLTTPLLSLIGAVCVALTVGMQRSGMLLALLVLPLYVPVLIFGAGACNAAQMGLPFLAPLLWLAAGLVLALVLAPLACAACAKRDAAVAGVIHPELGHLKPPLSPADEAFDGT